MKRILLLLTLVSLAGSAVAQDFVAPRGQRREVVVEQLAPKPSIEGIVTEVFSRKGWQALNPLAPSSYGSGEKMLSKDFGPGTTVHSRTLTVVGVEW